MNARFPAHISITRRLDASPEQVFDAWLDPDRTKSWLAAIDATGATGEVVRVNIDARVGGSFSLVERRDGEAIEHRGEYLEVDRPRLLVFTLSEGKDPAHESRVIIEIAPRRSGCELSLAHVEVRPDRSTQTARGWVRTLDALAAAVGAKPAASGSTRRSA
ncbi:MAG TPA: SRPBCC family protein [Burkholderiales bacterium]|nr:SRPBCC family protein [Burkholderiales bacterium]